MLHVNNIDVMSTSGMKILDGFSLQLEQGEVIGLTGESGAGKSTVVKSIMGILGKGAILRQGSITLDGLNLDSLPEKKRREICGTTIGFIPQNPITAFDSRQKIGKQIEETFCCRLKISKQRARELACEKLELVNLNDYGHVLGSLPMQLSGGMLQRVAFAILLGLSPKYVLADEPTSALDENNRNLLLELLQRQKATSGIVMISHDVSALEFLCEKVMVLYEGRIIEEGRMSEIMNTPKHAWTNQFSQCNSMHNQGDFIWKGL